MHVPSTSYRPTCLVFSSGGARGIAHFGVIRGLADRGVLKNVTCCIGCSAGAIAAAAVAIGMAPRQILRRAQATPLPSLNPCFETWKSGFGFGNDDLLDWAIDVALGSHADMELQEVRNVQGITLIVATTDLGAAKTIYVSGESHPTLKLRDALKMSCAIPLVFSARTLDGKTVVDGALTDWFPLSRGLQETGGDPSKVLGVRLTTAHTSAKITDFAAFAMSMLNCAMLSQAGNIADACPVVSVTFPITDRSVISVSAEWMGHAFQKGIEASDNLFESVRENTETKK